MGGKILIALGLFMLAVAGVGCDGGPTGKWELAAELHPEKQPHLMEFETRYLHFGDERAFASLGENWRAKNRSLNRGADKVWAGSEVLDLEIIVLKKGARTLLLDLHPQLVPDATQIVKVYINDLPLGECRFDPALGWNFQEFRIGLPESALRIGKNKLTFISRFAKSANEAGRGGDDRVAAFWLRTLKILDAAGGDTAVPDYERKYMENRDGVFALNPSSRLHFPIELPKAEKIELRFDPAVQGGSPKFLLATEDMLLSYVEVPMQDGRVDLSQYGGQLVDIVLDATEGERNYKDVQLWAMNPQVIPTSPKETLALPKVENVLMISLDALRADALGAYGYTRETSPAIDALAKDSLKLDYTFSSAPFTYSSVWSVVSGLHPFQHGARVRETVPSLKLEMLPDTLSKSGINTACVAANSFLDNPAMTSRFDEFYRAMETNLLLTEEKRREPGRVTEAALEYLKNKKDQRFFLYLHYLQPHEPYYPAIPYLGSLSNLNEGALGGDAQTIWNIKYQTAYASSFQLADLRARYDENLRDVDEQVRIVLDALRDLGLSEKTAVIITSDHGEAFWEHESLSHNSDVYNEMVHIPFILHVPGHTWEEAHSSRVSSTVDTFPTICSLMGVPYPEWVSGAPISEMNFAGNEPHAYAGIYGTSLPTEAFFWDRFKLIRSPYSYEVQLYDLAADYREQYNLAFARPVLTMKLLSDALWWKQQEIQRWEKDGLPPEPYVESENDYSKELEALGYF